MSLPPTTKQLIEDAKLKVQGQVDALADFAIKFAAVQEALLVAQARTAEVMADLDAALVNLEQFEVSKDALLGTD